MKSLVATTTLFVALSFACVAHASDKISEKRTMRANGSLSVRNVSGSVRIVGTDEEMMYLSGRIGEGVDRVNVSGEDGNVRISVELKDRRNSNGDADAELEVRVPRNARIEVDCVSADVVIRDATGIANIRTVSGAIGISGELKTIELKSVSGDIRIEAVGERLLAQSVSGDIIVARAIGEVELETVSGDMRIDAGQVSRFRAKSVSGDIELKGDINGSGTSDIESHSGDIILELGDHTEASFEVHTFSGKVHGKGEGQNPARFVLGHGTARVSIHTFSGDVRVRTP